MNKGESQDVVNQVNKDLENVRAGERVKEYLNRGISRAWTNETKNNANDGDNSSTSFGAENGVVGSDILRKGRYFDNPELYSEVKRTDSGSTGRGKVRNSLISPEMDASYLDAVNNGDMETAQRMVDDIAKASGYAIRGEHGRPAEVAPTTPRLLSWEDMCATIDRYCDIVSETETLKRSPKHFESLRNDYRYREEYF